MPVELTRPSGKDAATSATGLRNEKTSVALTPDRNLPAEEKRAQRKAAQEDVLLREVDDAVRQDQYAEFGRKYGRPLLAGLVLLLVAFGGFLFWQSRQEAALERDSEVLVGALDQIESGNLDSGSAALDPLLADGGDAGRTAATMLKAGIAMQRGEAAQAADLFGQVAADEDAPQAMRDLATVRAVAAQYDSMRPADVVARLKPLAVPGNAWFGSAAELVAMAYLEQGKTAEAGTLFAAIAKDDGTPETLKARARQMSGLLGVDAIEDVDALLEEQGAGQAPPALAQ